MNVCSADLTSGTPQCIIPIIFAHPKNRKNVKRPSIPVLSTRSHRKFQSETILFLYHLKRSVKHETYNRDKAKVYVKI